MYIYVCLYRHRILDQCSKPSELGYTYAAIHNQSEYEHKIQYKLNQINVEYNNKLQSLDELRQLITIQNNTVNKDEAELHSIRRYNDELKRKIDSTYHLV